MIAPLVALSLAQTSFRIKVEVGGPWLVHGKDRFLLPEEYGNWAWLYDQSSLVGWNVGKGLTIKRVTRGPQEWELLNLAAIRNGKEVERLDFQTLGRQWLAKDELWGGHEKANNLRFSTHRIWASEFMPAPGLSPKWGLAVLTLQNMSESVQPILNQALVRIDFTPLKATFVAEIGYPRFRNEVVTPGYHRLVARPNAIHITLPNGFTYYDPNKKFGTDIFPEFSSDEIPLGAIAGGDIVVLNQKTNQVRLFTTSKRLDARFDLKDPNINLLEGIPNADTSLFRLGSMVFSRKNLQGIVFKTPVLLWKEWAIEWDGKMAVIREGSTGKILTKVQKPKPKVTGTKHSTR